MRQPLRDTAATFNESGPEQCSLRTDQRNVFVSGSTRWAVREGVHLGGLNANGLELKYISKLDKEYKVTHKI